MTTVSLILGSVRPNRNGERLYKFMEKAIKDKGWKVHKIDPLELDLPVMMNKYDWIKGKPDCPPQLHTVAQKLNESHCFLVISPEYNHSIPPAISNTMDYFYH